MSHLTLPMFPFSLRQQLLSRSKTPIMHTITIVSTPPLLSATMFRTLFSDEFCGAADFLNLPPPDRPDPLGRGDGNRRCTVLGNLLCDYQSPPSITHCSTPTRSGAQARAFAIVHSSMLEKMDG